MDWFLGRMKAWMATAVPAVTGALLKSFEQAMGFDIPTDVEIMIMSAVTGLVVYAVPNKTAA
jgi:hypothetical protein